MQPSVETHNLGGVEIQVVGHPPVMPANPDQEEYTWATVKLARHTPVLMQDGASWQVSRPPVVLRDARIQVVLENPVDRTTATFTVPAEDVEIPIWNVGMTPPSDVAEPATGVAVSDDPDPIPMPSGPGQHVPHPSEPSVRAQTPVGVITPPRPWKVPGKPGVAFG